MLDSSHAIDFSQGESLTAFDKNIGIDLPSGSQLPGIFSCCSFADGSHSPLAGLTGQVLRTDGSGFCARYPEQVSQVHIQAVEGGRFLSGDVRIPASQQYDE